MEQQMDMNVEDIDAAYQSIIGEISGQLSRAHATNMSLRRTIAVLEARLSEQDEAKQEQLPISETVANGKGK